LRWGLGVFLNPLFPTLPLGTLAANLAGGLMMGCVMGLFDHFQTLSPELRLFVFTGFLGGLTTFSTFSAESATLLLRQQYLWFSGHVLVHVIGSLAMTVMGIALTRSLLRH
jgi:fluoride exporter